MAVMRRAIGSSQVAAIAKAEELHASGAGAEVLQDVLTQARKLLIVIDDELAANQPAGPDDARKALEEIRAELVELQNGPVTRH